MDDSVYLKCKCTLCDQDIERSSDEVACVVCRTRFHAECAKINDNMDIWNCPACYKMKSLTLQPPGAPRSKRSSKRISKASKSTTSSKAQALLNTFDEEKALLERQTQEKQRLLNETHEKQMDLLKKKQDALLELVSSRSESTRRSQLSVSEVNSQDKVKDWINSQKQINPKPTTIPEQEEKTNTIYPRTELPTIRFNNEAVNKTTTFHLPTQPPGPILSSTFNVNKNRGSICPENPGNSIRRLSREEIAARHVVKELPKFDGNPRIWPRFITSFRRSTEVCGFNNLENLERISNSLCGTALVSVESSLTMEENVPYILETLEELFGKPEFVINSLINEMRLSELPSEDRIDSIIKYSLQIGNISNTMKGAKLSEHLWNPTLLWEMVSRLPNTLKVQWGDIKLSNPHCNIEVFAMWLQNKARAYASVLTEPPNLQSSSGRQKNKHTINVHQECVTTGCLICSDKCLKVEDCKAFQKMSLVDKWKAVNKHNLCRTCLYKRNTHKNKLCDKDVLCGVNDCKFRHHSMLHNSEKDRQNEVDKSEKDLTQRTLPEAVLVHFNQHRTYFKILPVCVQNGSKKMTIFAMLDDGSSLTLIDEKVAKYLEIAGERKPLCLRWTKGVERRDNTSEIISINVSGCSNEEKKFILNDVRTVHDLNLPLQTLNMEDLSNSYDHLKGLPIKSYENVQPLLLIGLNHSKLMAVKKYRFGEANEPACAKTPLGWCIFGSTSNSSEVYHVNHCDCDKLSDDKLADMVQYNYALDAIGVSNSVENFRSKEEDRAMSMLRQTTKFNGQSYEVGLLWKYDSFNVPNNLVMATRRHKCLEKRFKTEPELPNIIDNQIQDYLNKGYASKVDSSKVGEIKWYLPIFIVRNPNKPNKVRLVWDAAAEVYGVSLNKMLVKGPDLLASLPGILLRFREHQVALSGDIKEMFHQIGIKKEDRMFQCFIWKKSPECDFDVYQMNVMTFGAACSPCCSQYVKNENAKRFRDQFPKAVEAIEKNHYVDDWLESVDTTNEAIKLAEEVKNIHGQGGFEIRNWISNDPEVYAKLNQNSSNEVKNMEISSTNQSDKILGMFWKTSVDTFTYILKVTEANISIFKGEKVPSKREVLRILMSVFDPLGLIANVLIFPKILLQRIWRSKINWDESISEEHHKLWVLWSGSLGMLAELEIPRWIGLLTKGTPIEMHCFVDASEDAYGAAIYLKVTTHEGVKSSLVASKSRVAPLRGLTVPRLELQAAVVGVRLTKFVTDNLSPQHKINRRYFWSDSETVMKWLRSDNRRYTQYVGCRIGEILEHTKIHEWNWISGKMNVADMLTKMKIMDLTNMVEWLRGPSFLFGDNYPVQQVTSNDTTEELRAQIQLHVNYDDTEFRISKWTRLRRVFAFVLRFIGNLQLLRHQQNAVKGPITNEEYIKADNYLFRKAQSELYPEELKEITKYGSVKNRTSPVYKDSPFLDRFGVMRAKGRTQFTPLISYEIKNPILMPKDHRITSTILQFYHERYHHQNYSTVFNEVRQKFIIPNLKAQLKRIRKQCQYCKNRDAQPDVPEESPLPLSRVTPFTAAFTFVGIDYFGPMQVVIGRRREKRWCMLITCLTTRAVHTEVAHSLSTDSCILGLRRFMSRRGKPREIYSDNGTNFRGTRRELRAMWENIDKDKLAETFMDEDTKWMFIPPASPHMGGAWERMVRSIKTVLKVAMPTRAPTDELLLTMLAEVENIVNNRPLTHVAIEENEEALTPNHFLLGSSSGVKPIGKFENDSGILRANWCKAQAFANFFWKRWVKEYLPTLSRRTKWFVPSSSELSVGDIVIVLGEPTTGKWPKGRILDICRGKDNKVRSAVVQMEAGIYTRPVSKLAVLDVCVKGKDGTLEACPKIPGGTVDSDTN